VDAKQPSRAAQVDEPEVPQELLVHDPPDAPQLQPEVPDASMLWPGSRNVAHIIGANRLFMPWQGQHFFCKKKPWNEELALIKTIVVARRRDRHLLVF
jgi:hypothetical protein